MGDEEYRWMVVLQVDGGDWSDRARIGGKSLAGLDLVPSVGDSLDLTVSIVLVGWMWDSRWA